MTRENRDGNTFDMFTCIWDVPNFEFQLQYIQFVSWFYSYLQAECQDGTLK